MKDNSAMHLPGCVRMLLASAVLWVFSGGAFMCAPIEHARAVGGQAFQLTARPELGYTVKSRRSDAAVGAVREHLRAGGAQHIRPVKGFGRKGNYVVHRPRPAIDNEKAIAAIRAGGHVEYVAPLFSSNADTIAIVPEIVVRLKSADDRSRLQALCEDTGLRISRKMQFTELEYLVEVFARDANDVFGAVAQLNRVSFIEWAAPNTVSDPVLHGHTVPARRNIPGQPHVGDPGQTSGAPVVLVNDEYFPRQWHLHNTGQSGGAPGADINAPGAWAITAGDPNIIVAVQDTGVDLNHPDLASNLVPGDDFFDDDDSPNPELDAGFLESHGTACAGLVAAVGDNGIGVAGVAYKCKVMPIRDMTWNQAVTEADKAEAIRWSAANGADVMSYSWGYTTPRPIIHSAIKDIVRSGGIGRGGKGCVVFVAAGNSAGAMPSGDTAAYPEVIAVGATDHNDRRCWYSAYGPAIDIVAPGGGAAEGDDLSLQENVESYMLLSMDLIWTTDMTGDVGFSTFNDNPHLLDYTAKMFGTSAAAPIAAGVAALILSVDPDLTGADVRRILLGSARDLGAPGWDEYYGHGRVDARAALEMALNPPKRASGDLDDDSDVDFEDFAIFGIHWRRLECSEQNNCSSGADLAPEIPDGLVNALDLAVFAENWLADVTICNQE